MTPVENGCICQTCSERGIECSLVCSTEWDEQCPACLDGHHAANERGRPTRRFEAQVERPSRNGIGRMTASPAMGLTEPAFPPAADVELIAGDAREPR